MFCVHQNIISKIVCKHNYLCAYFRNFSSKQCTLFFDKRPQNMSLATKIATPRSNANGNEYLIEKYIVLEITIYNNKRKCMFVNMYVCVQTHA